MDIDEIKKRLNYNENALSCDLDDLSDCVEYLLYLLNRADEHLNALYKAKDYDECQNIVNNYMIKGSPIA